MDISEDRLEELIQTADVRILISTEEGGDGEASVGDTLAHPDSDLDEDLARRSLAGIVREAVAILPERDQLIIDLYYYRDLNFKEIADVLGVTESRVSQLHSRIRTRLRDHLPTQSA